ncbi:MAG: tetratricopeptide repeat protein [Candidatus Latescibacterota bacterium]|nr:MAG: tetratricopeptide repeat protein [Candidatus Latescibacterota bacterium]
MTDESKSHPKIAVLYFANLTGNEENSYVCAGITEEIIRKLSRIDGLTVVSRSDVLPCRNLDVDTCEFGRCMGVDFVLEGGVWEATAGMEVVTKLVDVGKGRDVTTARFAISAKDILAVPGDAAVRIAEILDIPIGPDQRKTLTRPVTEDLRAYEQYMRGRELLSLRGVKNNETAIQVLESAVALDPGFAAAHGSLGEAYSNMYNYYDSDEGWLEKIVDASERAIALDPDSVEPRFNLGIVHFHKREYEKAKATFESIIQLRARYYEGYRWLGIVSDVTGRYDDALRYYEKSAEIKPCSVEPWLYMNMTYRRKGDIEAAKYAAKRFLEVGIKTLQIIPDDPVTLSRFSVIYTLFGDRQKAYDAVNRILDKDPDDGLVLYNCAATFALLNDNDRSLECLRRALGSGYKNIREWINSDPDFDDLRDTEEFRTLLSKFDLLHGG